MVVVLGTYAELANVRKHEETATHMTRLVESGNREDGGLEFESTTEEHLV